MNLREKLLFVPAIVVEGIRLWVDPPRRLKLKVDHDYETRRGRERRAMEELYDLPPEIPLDVMPPTLKCIHLDHPYRAGGQDRVTQLRVAIDLNKRRLDWTYTTDWLFGREHNSGAIGVILFSLPVTLLLSPVLILARRCYEWAEKRRGISRHGHALLRSLRGQLDRETETLLTEALKNTWKHEQAMNRQVTLDEAVAVLAACDLRETTASGEGGVIARELCWFDDQGNCVARGDFFGQDYGEVAVLGSFFDNAEANALSGCYRSRRLRDLGCAEVKEE